MVSTSFESFSDLSFLSEMPPSLGSIVLELMLGDREFNSIALHIVIVSY